MARRIDPKATASTPVMQPRRGPATPQPEGDPNYQWITSDEPHIGVSATVKRLVQDSQPRLWDNTRLMALYANQDLLQTSYGTNASVGAQNSRRSMPRQTANLAKVYGDTLAGKLVQSNSKVTPVASNGDWTVHRLAKKLDAALEGEFRRGNLYEVASEIAIDAINTGTGYLHTFCDYDSKCVRFERWFPNEVFIDPLEAAYGQATIMFRQRYIKRENALAWWGSDPEKARIIEAAGPALAPAFSWTLYQTGMITLYEAWALPMGSRKGRHVLCFSSGCVVDEKWTSPRFPVAVFKAGKNPIGWYGQGILEHVASTQIQLNRVLNIMARSAELGIAPFWVVEGGAEVSLKQISNVEGHIVTSSGPPPQWVTNPPFHPAATQYVEYLRNLISMGYGVNEIEAAGQQGFSRVDSDPALTNLQDMWIVRHYILLKNWSESFFLDVAKRTVDAGRELAEKYGSYPVQGSVRGRPQMLDWNDFKELDDSCYTLQMSTMNYLPTTPSAKFQRVVQLKTEGLITPERATGMLAGPPDLDSVTSEISAVDNDIDRIIEELSDGKNADVSGLTDMDQAIPRIRAAGLRAIDNGADDSVVQNFERWVASATLQATANSLGAMMGGPAAGAASGSFGPAGGLGGSAAGGINLSPGAAIPPGGIAAPPIGP